MLSLILLFRLASRRPARQRSKPSVDTLPRLVVAEWILFMPQWCMPPARWPLEWAYRQAQ